MIILDVYFKYNLKCGVFVLKTGMMQHNFSVGTRIRRTCSFEIYFSFFCALYQRELIYVSDLLKYSLKMFKDSHTISRTLPKLFEKFYKKLSEHYKYFGKFSKKKVLERIIGKIFLEDHQKLQKVPSKLEKIFYQMLFGNSQTSFSKYPFQIFHN